jgi:RHS repeat-associated protein
MVISTALNNTTTRFYAGNYQKDTTNGTSKKIHYIMGGTGLVAVYIKKNTDSGNLYYVCTDRQGSITALLNPNGSVAEKYSYDAYGRRRNPLNWNDYNVPAPSLINRGYTGHEHLDGFGLLNMNGRMYDPVIGRVLSPDKLVQAPSYTQSYNRYSYCMNNPLRYTDPSGWSMMLSNGSIVGQDFNDWGISNSANLGMPGSGGNWSDGIRGQYGNSMLGDQRSYDKMYGEGAWEIAQSLASNPATRNQWRQGMISIEQIRRNGGNPYLGPTAGLAGTPGVSVVENQYGKWEYSLQSIWVQTAGRTQVSAVVTGNGESDSDNWVNNFWTAATLTANWLVGGNQNFTFNNNATASAMRNSPGIVKARNDYYASGKTFGSYKFGLKGLVNAGIDPIEQFVGSYNYNISVVGNNLQFTLINTTSFSSAAYHLWPSSWNWTNAPMGSTTQTYIFTEPLLQIKK